MKKISLIFSLIATILLSSCLSSKKKEQTISLSGAWALYPLTVKWAEEYKKEHPEIRFNITGGGAGKGLADALAEVVDLGMFSREITQEEKDKGTWWTGLTIDAVLPVMNANNPYIDIIKKRGITKEEFRGIYIDGTINNWGKLLKISDGKKIDIYTRSDACGAAETFAKFMGGKQEDLKGIGVYGDPGLAEAVAKAPVGIGYNNTVYVYDLKTRKTNPGLLVIPIDINGNGTIDPDEDFYNTYDDVQNGIATGRYPAPPARELYFVAKGKPQKKAVINFIKWTLTDGQKFVEEAGYVTLAQDRIDHYLKILKQ